jgi:lipid-A-disaccharide synthase
VPFFSMVNLLAGEKVAPELIQGDCTSPRLVAEARALLGSPERLASMRESLGRLREKLAAGHGAMERAVDVIQEVLAAVGQPGGAVQRVTLEARSR